MNSFSQFSDRQLPQDTWNTIFDAFRTDSVCWWLGKESTNSLSRLACCSRALKASVDAYRLIQMDKGRSLFSLGITSELGFEALIPIANQSQHTITWLNFKHCKITTAKACSLIGELKELLHLDLEAAPINDEEFTPIGKLENLVSLNLKGCELLRDKTLARIATFKKLEQLNLALWDDYAISSEGLNSISQQQTLTHLKLDSSYRIFDEDLACLSTLTSLQKLSLRGLLNITDEGLRHISKLTKLEQLDLRACKRVRSREEMTNITPLGLSYIPSHVKVLRDT